MLQIRGEGSNTSFEVPVTLRPEVENNCVIHRESIKPEICNNRSLGWSVFLHFEISWGNCRSVNEIELQNGYCKFIPGNFSGKCFDIRLFMWYFMSERFIKTYDTGEVSFVSPQPYILNGFGNNTLSCSKWYFLVLDAQVNCVRWNHLEVFWLCSALTF